ncbi:MAG: helicase C-terminal domain-containing protein [Enterococcus sp.]
MKSTTYAIVDIETTGTNAKTDRIIQFGCVLIEDGAIVSRFATDVNPGRPISAQIQSLTGITNTQVQKAPYFEDVAHTIYHLLADTVFIAHNIYFDYQFLSRELKRCGAPELTIPGVDTVELAQIFFPTEQSFRLSDLTESFGLTHEHPHQADSDAEVTGELFLLIQEKMRQLPLTTLERIATLSQHTGMDTQLFIKKMIEEIKQKVQPLHPELEVIEGVALKKKAVERFSQTYYETTQTNFPRKKQAKERLFGEKLVYRKEQNRLMNVVYDHFTKKEEKNLMIEAATGMGKTIGYLLPMSYLATPEQPVIISTVSLVLQNQLMEKDIPMLNQVLEQPIQATVVKSHRHYIDLQRFYATLQHPLEQKQYALYQMAVLVWLTETNTGDLDELHMTSLNHQFFLDVRHRGTTFLSKNKPFYSQDFLLHLKKRMGQSNCLIVNHAFLVQENLREQPLLPKSPYLIIDEAHHLPEVAERVSDHRLDLGKFHKYVRQISESDHLFERLEQLVQTNATLAHLFDLYQQELSELIETQVVFAESLYRTGRIPRPSGRVTEEFLVTKEIMELLPRDGEIALSHMQLFYREIQQLQKQMTELFSLQQDDWEQRIKIDLAELFRLFEQLEEQAVLVEHWTEDWRENLVHWLLPAGDPQYSVFHLHDFKAGIIPNTKWYQRYEHILYIGGTLKIGADRDYLARRLGIPGTRLKIIQSPYDYTTQARLYLPNEAPAINQSSSEEYAAYLVSVLTELINKETRPILVLFTSHDILQRVYQEMHLSMLNQGREILAQGFGGSREKLLKRFTLSEDSVLFGADSFWEGVDLPGDALQIVVVTRLPFENPKRPMVQARNNFLKSEGLSPFYQEAVPQAALKLRQALGRLIRSQEDKGVLLVLDRRLVTAKYGQRMLRALPKGLIVEEKPITEISTLIQEFLRKNQELS